jgi:uncharacterized membrane protein YdbT with pleckstrin-like domain
MAARAAVRASDADREHVAERLRKAAGEGRLRTEELEERLETALSARTYGQLDSLLRDLPGRRLVVPSQPRSPSVGRTALALTLAVATTVVVAIAVVFIVTGVFAGWLLWIIAGWFFFGRRRRHALGVHGGRYARSLHGCGGWSAGRPPRYWA